MKVKVLLRGIFIIIIAVSLFSFLQDDESFSHGDASSNKLPISPQQMNALNAQASALQDYYSDVSLHKSIGLIEITLGAQTVFFEHGKAFLTPKAKEELVPLAEQLVYDNYVAVVGHTDETGSEDMNIVLSKKRSKSVKECLLNYNEKVIGRRIFTFGLGEEMNNPLYDSNKWQRRVVIYISPYLPNFEGKYPNPSDEDEEENEEENEETEEDEIDNEGGENENWEAQLNDFMESHKGIVELLGIFLGILGLIYSMK